MELKNSLDNILSNIHDARYSNVEDLEEQLDQLLQHDFQNLNNTLLLNFKLFADEKGFLPFLSTTKTLKDSLKQNMKKVILKFIVKCVKRGGLVLTENLPILLVD